MDQHLWAKIEGIFHAVLELSPNQRPALPGLSVRQR